MSDLPIINTTIKVENVKDIPYKRKLKQDDGSVLNVDAVGKAIGHKHADGSWLNLTDFDEARFGLYFPGSTLAVSYSEKFATEPNGAPKIDKYTQMQKVYRTIIAAEHIGAPPMAQNGVPSAQGSTAPAQGYSSSERDQSIRDQVCIKASAEIIAAEISATKGGRFEFDRFSEIFSAVRARLDGVSNEFDASVMEKAKKAAASAGLTEEPPIGFDDPPEPDGSPDDDEFKGTF